MTSTITLYKSCLVEQDKNFIVEFHKKKAIELYLNTLEKEIISDFQYIKQNLTLSIKINKNQSSLMMGENSQDVNYCKIQNGDENPYYYFIVEKYWKSENTIELVLAMDTLNTFEFNSDYVISPKSKILREHRDRYIDKVFSEVMAQDNITIKMNYLYVDTGEWWGEVYLLPNQALIDLANYNIELEGNGSASLDTSTGVVHLIARGGTYENEERNLFYKVILNKGHRVVKNIDFVDEGINPQLYRGEESEIIQDFDTSWNLVYKNKNDIEPTQVNQINPVECFAIPDNTHKVKSASSTIIYYSAINTNIYYYISPSNNNGLEIRFKDNTGHIYVLNQRIVNNTYGYSIQELYWITIYRTAGNDFFTVNYHWLYKRYNGSILEESRNEILYTASNITSLEVLNNIDFVNYATSNVDNFPEWNPTISGSFYFTIQDKYLLSLASLDRTDSKLIKIIKLPYCPSKSYITANDDIVLDSNWTFDDATGFYKLNDLNTKFNYEADAPFNDPMLTILEAPSVFNPLLNKDIQYETKLLNSQFYYPKFVYDSFGFAFDLEKIDIEKYMNSKTSDAFKYGFVVTTTINSKFMFYFPDYKLQAYKKTGDYDAILPIARNNEVVLYNNQYINYLRTGYNYDLKNKNRTEATSGISTVLGIIGAVASIGLGAASGNPAIAVGGLLGGVSSVTSSVMNNVNTIAREETNMASKLEQLRAQSTSVAGSDDIDLLEAYSNNRAKMTEYRVSDRMKTALYDLFYYFGYKTAEMKIPNVYSRFWFNFLQAELDITQTSNLSSLITEDIKEKFKNGVTFMHTIEIDDEMHWDFEQDKENWEIALMGGN